MPRWTCPRCDREFGRANQAHTCVPGGTVADTFAGRPDGQVDAYRRITVVLPNDPTVQLELAQAAQGAGDTATTIAAYEAFLKIAPEDPTAVEVRRILKQLRLFGTTG